MRNIYRITILFTEEKYKDNKPSNIFLKASSIEEARLIASKAFEKELDLYNLTGAKYSVESALSCEEEVDNYKANMDKDQSRMVN